MRPLWQIRAMSQPPATPLLPSHYDTAPFERATALLDDPARLRAQAERLGYLYLPELLPLATVAAVRAFVRDHAVESGWVLPAADNPPALQARPGAHMSGRGWDDVDWIELQRAVNVDEAFANLANNERLLAVLAMVAGEPMAPATSNHCWLKLPGSPEHTTRPHQDTFYLPDCPRMWTAWVPLAETPMEVGPLGVIRGSHNERWQHIDPWTGIDVPRTARWDTEAAGPGAVLLFNAATVHCAWSNMSADLARLSLDVRYEPASLAPVSILRPGAEPNVG